MTGTNLSIWDDEFCFLLLTGCHKVFPMLWKKYLTLYLTYATTMKCYSLKKNALIGGKSNPSAFTAMTSFIPKDGKACSLAHISGTQLVFGRIRKSQPRGRRKKSADSYLSCRHQQKGIHDRQHLAYVKICRNSFLW